MLPNTSGLKKLTLYAVLCAQGKPYRSRTVLSLYQG